MKNLGLLFAIFVMAGCAAKDLFSPSITAPPQVQPSNRKDFPEFEVVDDFDGQFLDLGPHGEVLYQTASPGISPVLRRIPIPGAMRDLSWKNTIDDAPAFVRSNRTNSPAKSIDYLGQDGQPKHLLSRNPIREIIDGRIVDLEPARFSSDLRFYAGNKHLYWRQKSSPFIKILHQEPYCFDPIFRDGRIIYQIGLISDDAKTFAIDPLGTTVELTNIGKHQVVDFMMPAASLARSGNGFQLVDSGRKTEIKGGQALRLVEHQNRAFAVGYSYQLSSSANGHATLCAWNSDGSIIRLTDSCPELDQKLANRELINEVWMASNSAGYLAIEVNLRTEASPGSPPWVNHIFVLRAK